MLRPGILISMLDRSWSKAVFWIQLIFPFKWIPEFSVKSKLSVLSMVVMSKKSFTVVYSISYQKWTDIPPFFDRGWFAQSWLLTVDSRQLSVISYQLSVVGASVGANFKIFGVIVKRDLNVYWAPKSWSQYATLRVCQAPKSWSKYTKFQRK